MSISNEWVDPDDAPPLTREWFDKAHVKAAGVAVDDSVQRSEAGKEQVALRIDMDVLRRFRSGGPGWESRINAALRDAAGM